MLGDPKPGELLGLHSKEWRVKEEDRAGSVMNGMRQQGCFSRCPLASDMHQCCYLEAPGTGSLL